MRDPMRSHGVPCDPARSQLALDLPHGCVAPPNASIPEPSLGLLPLYGMGHNWIANYFWESCALICWG